VVYVCTLLLSGAVLLTSAHALPAFHETQWYAGLAFVFLYLTLLAGPLYTTRRLAGMEARRALGLSTCYFALLHSYFGFYRFVGGLDGLRYWSSYFAWSLFAGLLALVLSRRHVELVRRPGAAGQRGLGSVGGVAAVLERHRRPLGRELLGDQRVPYRRAARDPGRI
jgi:hypothetical protein